MRFADLVLLAVVLCSCGSNPDTSDMLHTRRVTLPNGQQILAELATGQDEMARGMMFRDSLAPDRGMLFVHEKPGAYPYWMYQVRIPLDIIWMDTDHRIVEISADTPPCKTEASGCPNYGGNHDAQFVLELAGGMAAKYGLKTGDRLVF